VKRSRCLVTGGAGFIGSHITERLLKLGHRVICLDNFDDYYDVSLKEANVRPFLRSTDYSLVRGSILDGEALALCMEGTDYVFHCAARAGVRESLKDPLRAHEANATGTLMVLEAARSAGVKKLIYSSSSSVYGNAKRLPVAETDPAKPISPYGASKLCAENYCEAYRGLYGMDSVSLRYFTVFGPRMRPDLAISIFVHSALAGRDIEVFGDGNKSRDLTFVEDVVDANILAMSRGHGVYNIGSGRSTTVDRLARTIVELTGSRSRIRYRSDAPGDMEHTLADCSRAMSELGYTPAVGLVEGLKRYIGHVIEADSALSAIPLMR
jgi:UDP-glucose 4-epimerase